MDMKPIDLINGICPNCLRDDKIWHPTRYYCNIIRDLKADDPCNVIDWQHCPLNKEAEKQIKTISQKINRKRMKNGQSI